MKSVIKQVLDLDARAQQKLQEAYRKREEEMARVDEEAQKARQELSEHCEERIKKVYDQEKAFCDEQLAGVAGNEEAAREKLQARFSEMEDQWVSGIVQSIIQ